MTTPYVAIGMNELWEETETIQCPRCGQDHPIEYGTSKTLLPDNTWTEPKPSKLLGFYRCQDAMYLGTVEGRRWK